jgi:hypothetical protein
VVVEVAAAARLPRAVTLPPAAAPAGRQVAPALAEPEAGVDVNAEVPQRQVTRKAA